MAALQQQVKANSEQIDECKALIAATSGQMTDVVKELDAIVSMFREQSGVQSQLNGSVQDIQTQLSRLNDTVVNLSAGAHVDHVAIGNLEKRLERLAGSILDDTAVRRRLRRIEDRLLEPSSDDTPLEKPPQELPHGGV